MKLREWLFKNRVTTTDFAKKIGYNRATVFRWRSGKINPSRKAIDRIEKETNNEVQGLEEITD